MNRFTKITAALLMGLALAGCSDSDDDDDDRDDGPEISQTTQFSSWVSEMLNDDENAQPREVNDAALDFSSDNENEQAFNNVLND